MEKKKIDPKKLRQVIRTFKEKKKKKTEGDPKILNVSRTQKKPRRDTEMESKKHPGSSKPIAVGPKGGRYVEADTGKRYYLQREKERTFHRIKKSEIEEAEIKKSVGEFLKEKILNFITQFKEKKEE